MATKTAGLNAAGAVLIAIFGLVVLIGVILLMMWAQPDIQHSPSEQGRLGNPHHQMWRRQPSSRSLDGSGLIQARIPGSTR